MVSGNAKKLRGRHPENTAKILCKHGIARISHRRRNGGERVILVQGKIACHRDAELVEIVSKALPERLTEQAAKIALVKVQMRGDLLGG